LDASATAAAAAVSAAAMEVAVANVIANMANTSLQGKPFNHLRTAFDGTNYATWKFQMQLSLRVAGLARVVDGTEVCPSTPIAAQPTRDVLLWQQKDADAQSAILYNVDKKFHDLLMRCNNSHEMWEALRAKAESPNLDRAAELMDEWTALSMSGDVTMDEHIKTARRLLE
jgi:hypothetical protein